MFVQLATSIFDSLFWLHSSISVDFYFDALLQRVRLFVTSKSDVTVTEQLVAHNVAERVILLTDQDCSCVLLAGVVDHFDEVSVLESSTCKL